MMTESRVETSHCQIDLFAKCVLIVIENLYRYCGKFGSTLEEFGEYCLFIYYADQQMHNIHINNILFTVSTPACFNASAASSGSPKLVLC